MTLRGALTALFIFFVVPPVALVLFIVVGILSPESVMRSASSLIIGAGLFLAAGAIAFVAFGRKLRRAASEIERAARAIGDGDLRHRTPLYGRDELSRAGRAMNAMGESLERAVDASTIAARFDLLHRCRLAISRDTESVALALNAIGRTIDSPRVHPSVLKGAGRALRRLASRLTDVERALSDPDDPVPEGTLEDLARAEHAPRERVDLSRLVASCVERAGVADAPGIRVRVSVAGEGVEVSLPETAVRRALGDLLRNAAQAMPAGGILKVEARVDERGVGLTVIDSGLGMSADFQDRRLFRPFASGWPSGRGFGLSLYRTRAWARAMGGDVTVTSQAWVGTRVTLWLPVIDVDASVNGSPRAESANGRVGGTADPDDAAADTRERVRPGAHPL
jgi:signal transduction histidine kinase